MSLAGRYYDQTRHTSQAVLLQQYEQYLVFTDGMVTRRILLKQITCDERLIGFPITLRLPDGSVIEVDDLAGCQRLLRFLQHSAGERTVKFTAYLPYLLLGLLVTGAIILWIMTRYAMPTLAWLASQTISLQAEKHLSDKALRLLQDTTLTRASKLSTERITRLEALLQQITSSSRYHYTLLVVDSPQLEANAIALPAGTLVITDQLLSRLQHDDEVRALFAHLGGHVEARHALRNALQAAGPIATMLSLLGSHSSTEFIYVPLLINSVYDTSLEEEAENWARQRLREYHQSSYLLDPPGLTRMGKLADERDRVIFSLTG